MKQLVVVVAVVFSSSSSCSSSSSSSYSSSNSNSCSSSRSTCSQKSYRKEGGRERERGMKGGLISMKEKGRERVRDEGKRGGIEEEYLMRREE